MVRERKTFSVQALCIRKLGVEIQSRQPSAHSSHDWVVPTASSATASVVYSRVCCQNNRPIWEYNAELDNAQTLRQGIEDKGICTLSSRVASDPS